MAVVTTEDGWSADHWFGSIATLANAAEVAELELGEIDGNVEDGERVPGVTHYTTARISYEGGSFQADNLGEVREALGDLERRDGISSVRFHIQTPRYTAVVSAGHWSGVSVSAEGPRAAPVHGLVTTLQRKLEPGVGRVREQPLESISLGRLLFLAAGWVAAGFLYYLMIQSVIEFGFDFLIGLLFILTLFIPLIATMFVFDRSRPDPPTLELVPAAEEDVTPPPPDGRGPILRVRDWLQLHPIISMIGVLALAVAGNLITSAIT